MASCFSIAVVAFATYGLVAWPWFVLPEFRAPGLAAVLAMGAGGSVVFGALAAARLRLAGAVGFTGGAIASGAFMYLRMQHTFAARADPRAPVPEYPESLVVAVPLAWTAVALALGALFASRWRDPLQSG
jgi:hypothetical protein